ncbi:MAG TPA: CoA-binding protein [Caulobacteraceae bacterium]|nr:CoA-binding protein [Caulobacteraceae bacterium]
MSVLAPGFDRLLQPRSIAIIGASNRLPGIGGYVTANVVRAFKGPIYPVNPREAQVQGLEAYAEIGHLPPGIDLAIVVVPVRGVAEVLEALAAKGVGGVVIITSGFAEVGGPGIALQAEIAEILARTGLRAIGPNCIGYMNLADGVMANFVLDPTDPLPGGGPVALVSQSGGLGGYMVRKALTAGLNLGWFVSTGNEVDVSVAATLRVLVERDDVKVLLGAFEGLRDADAFVDTALRAAALDKPFVVLKAGRSDAAAAAAFAHTASVVGCAATFDAVCRQYGVFSVGSLEEMLDLGVIFQGGRRARGRRVGIVTGSGGAGVVVADACVLEGLQAPVLPAVDRAALAELMPQPFMGSLANPVDVTAQVLGTPGVMESVLNGVSASDGVDLVVPVIIGNPTLPGMYIRAHRGTDKPVAFVSTLPPTNLLDAGVPAYTDPRRAARALSALADFSLREPPTRRARALDPGRRNAARDLLARGPLTDAKALLGLYGAPTAPAGAIPRLRAEAHGVLTRDAVFGPLVAVVFGEGADDPHAERLVMQAPLAPAAASAAIEALLARRPRLAPGLGQEAADALGRLASALGDAALELPELDGIEVGPIQLVGARLCAAPARALVMQAAPAVEEV